MFSRDKAVRSSTKHDARQAPIETFWQMRGACDHVFVCAVYRTDMGLEMRVGYDARHPVTAVSVSDIDDARHRSANLRRILLEMGEFTEIAT
jgi:hypothetical protein